MRRQKLITKAKQQARLSPTSPSPTAMGKTIAKIDSPPKQIVEIQCEKEEKANSSESEYSSLEDDDDDVYGKKDPEYYVVCWHKFIMTLFLLQSLRIAMETI